jgi:hypothetical protein
VPSSRLSPAIACAGSRRRTPGARTPEGHHPGRPGELDARGVKFLPCGCAHPALTRHIASLQPADFKTVTLDRAGHFGQPAHPRVHEDPAAALRARLPGYAAVTPDVIQRRFLETPGHITTTSDTITVRLERRADSPVLRKASLPADTRVPWWGGRTLRCHVHAVLAPCRHSLPAVSDRRLTHAGHRTDTDLYRGLFAHAGHSRVSSIADD